MPTEEHLFEVLFATNYSISYADAKATITTEVQKLYAGDVLDSPAAGCEVEFRAFVDHNSVLWR